MNSLSWNPGFLSDRHCLDMISLATGITIHLILFRRGDWDLAAKSICRSYGLTFIIISGMVIYTEGASDALATTLILGRICYLLAVHLSGLTLSIFMYRKYFHRLCGFPGPSLAGFSSLYMLLLSVICHQSETLQSYHQRYGDYVRICPNKLSVIDPLAISAIYGRGSRTSKGAFSNTTHPRANLNMCRDKQEHGRRRKFWERALSMTSLQDRVSYIDKHTQLLLHQLRRRTEQEINIAKWLGFFSFDLLFDIGFSQDNRSLQRGQESLYMFCVQQVIDVTGLVMHAPWLLNLMSWIPGLSAHLLHFSKLSAEVVNERLANPGNRGDLFSTIMLSYDELESRTPQDFENLAGDADLLVLAGADSITNAISNLLYELTINPGQQKKLRQELASVKDFKNLQIRGHTLLDAFIYESLRMNPPAPTGHERVTPPEGLNIGSRFIPGNVSVFVPHYALFKDARFFGKPASFIPERWTTRSELNIDTSVYIPFQIGKNRCPGRSLALMEIRTIIASIICNFELYPASSSTKADFLDQRSDRWLLTVGPLNVVLHDIKQG